MGYFSNLGAGVATNLDEETQKQRAGLRVQPYVLPSQPPIGPGTAPLSKMFWNHTFVWNPKSLMYDVE